MQDSHSFKPIVQRILILLHSLSSSSSSNAFIWIPRHINLHDYDAVDFATKQSLLFNKITNPSLPPAYDLKTYYRFFITSWHNTWHTQPLTKLRSIKKKTNSMVLFKPYISPWRNNYITIENRPHPAHPLLSPTRTLLFTLMAVLPCRRNNCPWFLFMPISPKPQKILLCPVSPLFGSL